MEASPTIGALAGALALAQGDIKGALKDSTNPHFKSKYADLASIWEAGRKPLADNKLSVVQLPGPCENGSVQMTTMLMHESGEWIKETLGIPLGKVDAQSYGSAVTYARRYALAAMVGIAPDDDDGQAATANAPKQQAAKRERLEGKYGTMTDLRNAVKAWASQLRNAESVMEVYELELEAKDMFDQVKQYLPDWWNGGPGIEKTLPQTIEDKRNDFGEGSIISDMDEKNAN